MTQYQSFLVNRIAKDSQCSCTQIASFDKTGYQLNYAVTCNTPVEMV